MSRPRLRLLTLALQGRGAQRELRKPMQGLPQFRVHFSKSQVAASLWDCAEDDLADRPLASVASGEASLGDVRRPCGC